MPSYAFNQFVDLEEMMCKQLLSLDLREQSRPLQSLSVAMRTPGYTGQPRNEALFSSTSSLFSSSSHLSADPSDAAYLSSCQWGQQSDSSLPSHLPNSTRLGKPGFWAERSLSMVETSSTANTLGWPGTETKRSQTPTCPTPLSASSLPSSASSLLSPSSSASTSSSSRYKTEMCRTFAESGGCKYGNKCQFAHGPDELRDLSRHPKYKTEPCRTFHTIGFCPYGIRCHFVHNNEEEETHSSFSRSSSSSSAPPPSSSSSHPRRPPLLRQSFSFAGFPSAPPRPLQPSLPPPPPLLPPSFFRPPSASPPACADITDLLCHAFLELDSAFEASPGPQPAAPSMDPRAQFLPSPDSGCSLSGLSPASSPSGQSPGSTGAFAGPLGARSLSHTSLSDPDQEGSSGSSASSLSGSESCGGVTESNGKRLAVFSQLSVPEDVTGFFL